ncbi:protein RGF1 INDUCIBLE TRANSCRIPTION FACTOR 1 [Ricinus communis]|uniref:protein RGF1 INDUCIBLE TRANSCRIPTION FACTOR 1 n=1 Tax=Ricinus communis TaxID=3988 RepID=UPI00201A66FC|nr:protein RGF1 INDUCIBLE TRANSCRIPTION FACTOR 1 [Ricinus communis]XP_048231160.1 protein RGF1 INDUCIBLE TRANSCRIPTION FACTOR 1 [Ricinus communis]
MMIQSSSKEINQAEEATHHRHTKEPEWIEEFLKRTFFESCTTHPIRRNETNRYCINCNLSACQYCMSSATHRHHKILKIYRHVYKDVVSLGAMDKYIDCSQIQPYKCNKRLVISLNPLPHCGPLLNTGVCDVCKRRLAEPEHYSYCSISCKVRAFGRKSSDLDPPFLSIQQPPSSIRINKESNTEQPKRKRKGIPCRAPFF